MRHHVAHRKLGRLSEHRMALLRNQAEALIRHERISTTLPKAKELRPFVERLITIAKRGDADSKTPAQRVFARRLVLRDLPDRRVVAKLFDTIAPRFAERPGGYTRILKLGFRRGDGAELAQLELLGSEYNPDESRDDEAPKMARQRGVRGRLRDAARRLRGRQAERAPAAEASAEASDAQAGEEGAQAAPSAKSRTAKTSTAKRRATADEADKPKRARKKKDE